MKAVYAVLCVLGALLPLTQFVPWLAEYGLNIPLMVQQIAAEPLSAFAWLDVVVSAVVLIVFVYAEKQAFGYAQGLFFPAWLVRRGIAGPTPVFVDARISFGSRGQTDCLKKVYAMNYEELLAALGREADLERAVPMKAYMKNRFDYLGIGKPHLAEICKPLLKNAAAQAVDWQFVWQCWANPYRELQYCVLNYLKAVQKKLTPQDIPHLKKLITEKSWWDTADVLDRIVGGIAAAVVLVLAATALLQFLPALAQSIGAQRFWTVFTLLLGAEMLATVLFFAGPLVLRSLTVFFWQHDENPRELPPLPPAKSPPLHAFRAC